MSMSKLSLKVLLVAIKLILSASVGLSDKFLDDPNGCKKEIYILNDLARFFTSREAITFPSETNSS